MLAGMRPLRANREPEENGSRRLMMKEPIGFNRPQYGHDDMHQFIGRIAEPIGFNISSKSSPLLSLMTEPIAFNHPDDPQVRKLELDSLSPVEASVQL